MSLQQDYNAMVLQIAAMVDPPTSENYYPVISTPLELHSGIQITGKFETDDNTEKGSLSYVTVKRDATNADPANGYGFAWMKGDGSIVNVYLVDNSVLTNDLFINPQNIVNPQGENNWRAAAMIPILASTDSVSNEYNFELSIDPDYAMTLYIWKVGTTKPLTPTLYCGGPVTVPSATGTDFGIGVLGTHNRRWWYNDIVITTSAGIHTAVLFQLKARTTDFPDNTNVRVKYYGYGSDGTEGNENWGLTAYLYQKVDNVWTWVEIGSNTATSSTTQSATVIESDFTIDNTFRDEGDNVNLLVTSTYAASSTTDVTTYYARLEDAIPDGVHTGGCADIYINDPSRILIAENTLNNVSGNIALNADNGFLGPIHSIISVETSLIGDPLAINTDWTLVPGQSTYAFSLYEYPYLSFSSALLNFKIRVVYRYYHDGPAVQTLLNSDEYRYSGTSNIAKIMPPAIVTINSLDYKGTPTVETLRTALKTYINGATVGLVLTDIINLLYSYGVTWIDIPNIDISVTESNYMRMVLDPITLTDTVTITDLVSFFADDTSLAGLRKI